MVDYRSSVFSSGLFMKIVRVSSSSRTSTSANSSANSFFSAGNNHLSLHFYRNLFSATSILDKFTSWQIPIQIRKWWNLSDKIDIYLGIVRHVTQLIGCSRQLWKASRVLGRFSRNQHGDYHLVWEENKLRQKWRWSSSSMNEMVIDQSGYMSNKARHLSFIFPS